MGAFIQALLLVGLGYVIYHAYKFWKELRDWEDTF